MTSEAIQDYCDWCMGALTDAARAKSRWLGLPLQSAWACWDCIRAGRYRIPPDGWNGPVDEWLASDIFVLAEADHTAIANALNEVIHGPNAIDDQEFQVRMGVSRSNAIGTLRRILGDENS